MAEWGLSMVRGVRARRRRTRAGRGSHTEGDSDPRRWSRKQKQDASVTGSRATRNANSLLQASGAQVLSPCTLRSIPSLVLALTVLGAPSLLVAPQPRSQYPPPTCSTSIQLSPPFSAYAPSPSIHSKSSAHSFPIQAQGHLCPPPRKFPFNACLHPAHQLSSLSASQHPPPAKSRRPYIPLCHHILCLLPSFFHPPPQRHVRHPGPISREHPRHPRLLIRPLVVGHGSPCMGASLHVLQCYPRRH